MTRTPASVIPTLAPARLNDLMRNQPIDIQRHIHTAVIRAVGSGQLRGLKLAEQIRLPHCHDANRMINKSDIAFAAADITKVQQIIVQVAQKRAEKSHEMGRKRLNFQEFLKLSPAEFEQQLLWQLAEDERMRSYRR